MSGAAKSIWIAAAGVFTGATLFLWWVYGDSVYLAYLSGAFMRCF